jgi:hypothetical protein
MARGRRSTMGITSSTPEVPGAPDTEREEARASLVTLDKGAAAAGTRKDGTVSDKTETEEDWASLATGDPAFWLKG